MPTTTYAPAKAWIDRRCGCPVYATATDFETSWDADNTFPFFEDEDATGVFGFGHIDKDMFATEVNRYDHLATGADEPYLAEHVVHCWAVTTDPRGPDGLRFSWSGVDSRTLGSWPLTRINR
jgi:hypothetical protein